MAHLHTVYVLLTRYEDFFSHVLQHLTNSQFTHASICFDDDLNDFYSFRLEKGFCQEHPTLMNSPKKVMAICELYSVQVSDENYQRMKRYSKKFAHGDHTAYSSASLIAGLIGLPFHSLTGCFCSQFVAETLNKATTVLLSKPASRYFPQDFTQEADLTLCFRGTLGELASSLGHSSDISLSYA
ncbi:hypothetical protein I6N95_13945 [Vagococcus sp. BWB3-3]|uniref:Uncharacterized protein n=1 Tax=Vagococcus allomyrinae TaxID=2794353 RepID=A0A940SX84_9ENTE|nr:hypothetical protein [Vagococcus allomyrinae]MBP1042118.1 hypothetical protein [Vagococcus allomyrinae]